MYGFRSRSRREEDDDLSGFSHPLGGLYSSSGHAMQPQVHDEEKAVDSYEAWCQCADMISERDRELTRAWADQADGLVTFAALFSAVVTSFIIETYVALQPDPQQPIVNLLRQISAQLDGASLSTAEVPAAPFEPALSDVLRNSLLFASLICSLLAAGMGIFFKEWIREYTLDMPKNPRELVRVREFRHLGLRRWYMRVIIGAISIFLQLGVGLFICAVLLIVWSLHKVLRVVMGVFVGVWVVFWIGTAFCPTFSSNCPFRSPLARVIFAVITLGKHIVRAVQRARLRDGTSQRASSMLPTLEDLEEGHVRTRATALEVGALRYVFTTNRGDKRLPALGRCIQDLPWEHADALIEELLKSYRSTTQSKGDSQPPSNADGMDCDAMAYLEGLRTHLHGRGNQQPPMEQAESKPLPLEGAAGMQVQEILAETRQPRFFAEDDGDVTKDCDGTESALSSVPSLMTSAPPTSIAHEKTVAMMVQICPVGTARESIS
ncbi:hypothetical protein BV20DRAFT_1058149 [Pilatotrama ljubarskyi]|nr:hypothetical protein BV20DRAFT_1058149 [Pilatotrama ljubarskyi]